MTLENGHTVKSPNDLGEILAVQDYGKKKLIVREYGLETFQTALDPSRCRLKVIGRFPRKIINLNQIRYRLEQIERRKKHDNIFNRRTNTGAE